MLPRQGKGLHGNCSTRSHGSPWFPELIPLEIAQVLARKMLGSVGFHSLPRDIRSIPIWYACGNQLSYV